MPTRATCPNPPSQSSRPQYPAAVAGNSRTPGSPPMESSAAATCTSAWVSTPPVMTHASSTIVIAVPFLWLRDGTHPLAVGPVNPGLCQDRADQTGSAGGCQELGPGRQAGSRTTSTASAGSQVRPGPRLRRYARTTAKPRKYDGVPEPLPPLSLPNRRDAYHPD